MTATAPERGVVRRTVLAAGVSTVLAALPVFLLGGLAVLVRADQGFGESQLGLAVSAYFAVAALGAVPAGRVAARLGAWATTVLAAALSSGALLAMALAPSYPLLLAALAQIGSNQAIALVVRPGRQGLAFGVKQAAAVAGLTVGWRWTLATAARLAVAYPALAPRPPRGPVRPLPGRVGGGGAAGPLGFGLVVEASGYRAAWSASAVAFVLASGLMLAGRWMLRR